MENHICRTYVLCSVFAMLITTLLCALLNEKWEISKKILI
jgi:hypothetical protein